MRRAQYEFNLALQIHLAKGFIYGFMTNDLIIFGSQSSAGYWLEMLNTRIRFIKRFATKKHLPCCK